MKKDTKILAITSRDIVAAKAHYHASCYRIYTATKKEKEMHISTDAEVDDYNKAEAAAYTELIDFVRNYIYPKKCLISVISQ